MQSDTVLCLSHARSTAFAVLLFSMFARKHAHLVSGLVRAYYLQKYDLGAVFAKLAHWKQGYCQNGDGGTNWQIL
jgi:hypothetical protein